MLRGLFRFNCRFETEAVLPAFKGSVLRGIFGRALRQTSCIVSKTPCHRCHNNPTCLYPTIFYRASTQVPSNDRRTPPAPYVIEPPDTQQRRFAAGDTFEFNLLLFGEATFAGDLEAFMPLLTYGAELHLGKQTIFGLGKLTITIVS